MVEPRYRPRVFKARDSFYGILKGHSDSTKPIANYKSYRQAATGPGLRIVSEFVWDALHYVLKESVEIRVCAEDEGWAIECERYDLYSFAPSEQLAFRDLNEEFAILYNGLANEPDSSLTQDAREMRDKLLDEVKVREFAGLSD